MRRFSCDSTRPASSLSSATTDSAPTRSPYSENDFENELDTSSGPGVAANWRTTAPSASSAVAEALVGEIDERHETARADDAR